MITEKITWKLNSILAITCHLTITWLKFHAMTIIIKSVFDEGGKLYPQVFLDDTLQEL